MGLDRNPSAHAISAILLYHGNPVEYVDDYYIVDMYKKAYDEIVYPMP
jgi:hypothetical protein